MEGGKDDTTSLRVASFSCYLDTAKENQEHKISAQEVPIMLSSLKDSIFTHTNDTKLDSLRIDSLSYLKTPFQDPTPLNMITSPQELRRNGEISIFGADKYFSMKLDYQMEMMKAKVNLGRVGSNTKPRNPSLSSETTTCNGQTALLHRNGSQTKQKKAFGRRILSGFNCKGPCFDKNSVIIDQPVTRTRSQRSHGVATPPINETHEKLPANEEVEEVAANMDESRTSIEVFGSKALLKGDYTAKNMERKLSMLTWDAIPKAKSLQTTTESSTICDDMASEVSSELFEIDNISGSTMHRIMAADDEVSMSPASHYAPSEASIQWSVVTGSAVDFKADETSVVAKKETKSCRSRNIGGLLGCKSLKGLDVAHHNMLQLANEKYTKHQDLPNLSLSLATHSKMLSIIN